MYKTSNLLIILLSVFTIGLLMACNLPSAASKQQSTPVVASTVEATAAASIWENNFQNAPAGPVSVTFTESQLTSALDQFVKDQPSQPLSEPRISLQDSKIDLYGKVSQGPITTDIHLSMQPDVSADGKPVITILSGEVGPMPLPDGLKTSLSGWVDQAITTFLAANQLGFKLKSITTGNGTLTISGTKQ